MKYLNKLFFIIIIFSHSVNAQYKESNSYLRPQKIITIGDKGYSALKENDTYVFQKAVNTVHRKGGGHIIVPKGTYKLMNLNMKSDVHIIFKENVIIKPYTNDLVARGKKFKSGNIFNFNGDRVSITKNISVLGSKNKTIFDFSKTKEAIRVVSVGGCTNFKISDITLNDNKTVYSMITLGWDKVGDLLLIARDGLIENIIANNSNYGYGAVQAHSGSNIIFRNIESTGGVAVRLETGYKKMNLSGKGGLFNILVEDIVSKQGQAALFLQPHTMNHGRVVARNISAYGSEFAVSLGQPFVSKKKYKGVHKEPGSFESVLIENVKAVYTDGPITTRTAHLKYYPKELHGRLKKIGQIKGADYIGTSIAAVSNMFPKTSKVIIRNVEAIGFKYHPDIITKKDLFKGSLDHIKP